MFAEVEEVKRLILSSFNQLRFVEETHQYFIEDNELISVSNTIKNFYEPFDAEGNAARYGAKAEAKKAEWKKAGDDACDLGHKVHAFAETRFDNPNVIPSDGYEVGVMKFWASLPKWIIPVLKETKVYNRDKTFSGTFDVTLYDLKRQGIILADYKTNKNLFKNYKGKKMLPPFEFLLDTPYNHYQVQQSLYQIPLEEIGLKIIDRWLVHLIPNPTNPLTDGDFKKYELYDFTNHLKQWEKRK